MQCVMYARVRAHDYTCTCMQCRQERKRVMALYSEKNGRLSQHTRYPNVVHVWGLFSFYKGVERANDNVSRVVCPGDCESTKLTPRAHYNDYTAKERAEIGNYAAEGSRARGNAIRNSPKFKIAKLYT